MSARVLTAYLVSISLVAGIISQALAKPPQIVNIMVHDTSQDPLKSFMEQARALERQPGILSCSPRR